MEDQTVEAVKAELTKVAKGTMDAMAILGTLICASGNITKAEFLEIARNASAAFRGQGDDYAGILLDGMCKRLQKFEGLVPDDRSKH
jgi:hypothetical protein